jgi:hypothetical protein
MIGHYLSAVRPRKGTLTAEGHPRSVFYRAIERGNLLAAEDAIRNMGVVTLYEALQMTALVALRERDRVDPWARRWLIRFLEDLRKRSRQIR